MLGSDKLIKHQESPRSRSTISGEMVDPPFSWRSKIFKDELKTNLRMSLLVIITNVIEYLLNVETMSFCGRLSSVDMEGVGLALSIETVLGWCVCDGMVTGCDTMFAQAFGSDDKKRTGLFLQRGLLMLNLVPLLLISIHINMEPILIMLGQNVYIARATGEFMSTFSPGLIFMMNYLIFARYMQDQGCLWPPVVAGLCGNVFNIATQFFFVSYLGYGLKAAAMCHSFSYCVMLIYELTYIFKTRFYRDTWPGFLFEAWHDWSPILKLCVAGVAQITFEELIWEGNVFIGGIIGPIQLATQSILQQILNVMFVTYCGVGIASNIRVGQCLGANRPNQAKAAYRAGVVSTGIGIAIIDTLILSLRYQVPYIFTNKQEVVDMVIDVFPFVYVILFLDPFSGVCNATLRGCGRYAIGSLIIFFGFYVVGVPSCIILAFVFDLSIKGLWIGASIGVVCSVLITTILLECQDWKKQAKYATERVQYSSVKEIANKTDTESDNLLQPLTDDDQASFNKDQDSASFITEDVWLSSKYSVHKPFILKKLFVAFSVILFFVFGLMIQIFLPMILNFMFEM